MSERKISFSFMPLARKISKIVGTSMYISEKRDGQKARTRTDAREGLRKKKLGAADSARFVFAV